MDAAPGFKQCQLDKMKVEMKVDKIEQELASMQRELDAAVGDERQLLMQRMFIKEKTLLFLQEQLAGLQRQQAALQEQRKIVQQQQMQQLKQQTGATGVHRSWQSTFEPCTVMLLCAVCHCAVMLHSFLESNFALH
jgi:hydroxyacyl-ACP dehydratase HTD2-like protein with hotdog domain